MYRGDGQPAWKAFCEGVIVAVGFTVTSVVAAESDGGVVEWRIADGRQDDRARGSMPQACAVSDGGLVAKLLSEGGLEFLAPGRPPRVVPSAAATVLAFGPGGGSVVVAAEDGTIRAVESETGSVWGELSTGAPVRGAAWVSSGHWLVANPRRLLGVAGDCSEVLFEISIPDECAVLGELAVSRDGLVVASVMGANQVAVFELHTHRFIGTIDFRRPVGGVAFGGGSQLAISLDDGDLSLVDLGTGASARSEPHPGRGRTSWNLDVRVDLGAIRGARVKVQAGDAAIAAYTGWRPDDEDEGSWVQTCLGLATGCGCLSFGCLGFGLFLYLMRAYGYF